MSDKYRYLDEITDDVVAHLSIIGNAATELGIPEGEELLELLSFYASMRQAHRAEAFGWYYCRAIGVSLGIPGYSLYEIAERDGGWILQRNGLSFIYRETPAFPDNIAVVAQAITRSKA